MKIGTLTLHLPFNYGNALQMLSLHRYLLEQGYDAEVLSHWYFKNRGEVLMYHQEVKTVSGLVHFLLDCLMFGGVFCHFLRERKVDQWLRSKIKWSSEEGYDVNYPCANIKHDVLIVGSDQVWNPVHRTSEFFLLRDFPEGIKKIAYAASMGSCDFIDDKQTMFSNALKRFYRMSMRESSGVAIVKEKLGVPATLVCDPTLLHTKEQWAKILGFEFPKNVSNDIVVYLVTPDFESKWKEILNLARTTGRKVHFFAYRQPQWGISRFYVRYPIKTVCTALGNIGKRIALFFAGVRLHMSATPSEFVECIAKSEGLITDSFHGLMFATIFGKKCNVTIGEEASRQQMSARLRDFTRDFGRPDVLTPRIDWTAMQTVSITPKLQKLIDDSKAWLRVALEGKDA